MVQIIIWELSSSQKMYRLYENDTNVKDTIFGIFKQCSEKLGTR